MENSYGIGVANRYALFLDDESDPLETLKIKEQEKELKKKTKVAEKENKGKAEVPAKGKPAQPPKKVIKEVPHKVQENKREVEGKPIHQRSNDSTKPERTFNKFNNENREERNNRRNREDRPFNGGSFENNRDREDRPPRRDVAERGDRSERGERGENFESRRGGRGGLANKTEGGRGARGGPRRQFDDRRGKREFDRQSGSDKTHGYRGVKSIDKRDGGGAHNWGSNKDIIEEADATNKVAATESETNWGEPEKADAANTTGESKESGDPEVEAVPTEEEPKEMTLDEYKAQRAGRQKPKYNLRKAGEGEDPTQWKKMFELNKKKEGEEDSEDDEYDTSEYPQRVGRQKHVLGIDIHFNDARRGGTGRGRGARAGRGSRPNRESRGGGGGGRGDGNGGGGGGSSGGGGGGGGRGDAGGLAGDKRPDGPPGGNRFRVEREEQREDRVDARNAPKVDDERDFPSLG